MTTKETVICDAPGCGKDISQANGRHWRMQAYSHSVPMAPNTTPRHDAGTLTPLQHFCDEHCLAAWALAAAAQKDQAQAAFERALTMPE